MKELTRRDVGKLVLGGTALMGASALSVPSGSALSPLDIAKNGFYATHDTQCYAWCMANPHHPDQPMILEHIARQPVARWLLEGDNTETINAYLAAAMAKNQLGVFVAYNIPNRDLGSHSAGGASDASAYAKWAEQCAKAISNRPSILVLEPDCLMHSLELNEKQRFASYDLLNSAIDAFHRYAPNTWIYVDAGSGDWPPAKKTAELLSWLDLENVRGFAINISNYNTAELCKKQAEGIMTRLAELEKPVKGWVFDTSRNGNGPAPDNAWCNPAGRKIGKTASLGYMGADANLWVKLPGESDGECGAYPNLRAGAFSPIIASNLIKGI
jgi:endoglucanase